MEGVHPLEDLAPRDVVAATISRRMAEAPGGVGDHVFLDATHLGEGFDERFPSITQSCLAVGVDPARDRIPVAPAAHYVCGGVRPISVGHRDAGALRDRRSRLDRRARCEPSGIEQPHRGRRRRYPRGDGDRAALPVAVDVGSDAGRSYDAPLRNPAQRVELRSVMSNQVGVLRTPLGLDRRDSSAASVGGVFLGRGGRFASHVGGDQHPHGRGRGCEVGAHPDREPRLPSPRRPSGAS